jgi:hypothetical protein
MRYFLVRVGRLPKPTLGNHRVARWNTLKFQRAFFIYWEDTMFTKSRRYTFNNLIPYDH